MFLFPGLLRKKLNFDFVDNCDLDYHVDNEDDEEEMYNNTKKYLEGQGPSAMMTAEAEMDDKDSSFHSTPSRTRSGRIYTAATIAGSSTEKIKNNKKLPLPNLEAPRELNLLQKDLPKFNVNAGGLPPPLNYTKRPVSR